MLDISRSMVYILAITCESIDHRLFSCHCKLLQTLDIVEREVQKFGSVRIFFTIVINYVSFIDYETPFANTNALNRTWIGNNNCRDRVKSETRVGDRSRRGEEERFEIDVFTN